MYPRFLPKLSSACPMLLQATLSHRDLLERSRCGPLQWLRIAYENIYFIRSAMCSASVEKLHHGPLAKHRIPTYRSWLRCSAGDARQANFRQWGFPTEKIQGWPRRCRKLSATKPAVLCTTEKKKPQTLHVSCPAKKNTPPYLGRNPCKKERKPPRGRL